MPHTHHRARLRSRFISEGLDGFAPHEVLELILFYILPRQNTNPIAHALIDRFGSLSRVFEADVRELQEVEGIGESAAVFLHMLPQVWRLYRQDSSRQSRALDTYQKAGAYAVDMFLGRSREALALITLDNQCRLIHHHILHQGTVNEVSVHPRIILETVLRDNATQAMLVHNHPGGTVYPSKEDIHFTRRIAVGLSSVDITLVDHIIVSGHDSYSFAHEGDMERIKKEVAVRLLATHVSYDGQEPLNLQQAFNEARTPYRG